LKHWQRQLAKSIGRLKKSMDNKKEKYFWLMWMCGTTMISYLFFPFNLTISSFLAGLALVCKCLIEEYLHLNEEEKTH
jgi:hypothetical protein